MRQRSLIQVLILTAALILILTACNKRDETQAGQINETPVDSTCYLFVQARDSIKLSILQQSGAIKGTLQFRFYEKDKVTIREISSRDRAKKGK